MSEETPPAKKAARKTVRKKSASKRAPRKSSTSETSDEQLPLDTSPASAEPAPAETQNEGGGDNLAPEPKKRSREPKSGVRDARRETSDEPLHNEVSEKLIDPDSAPQKEKDKDDRKQKPGDQNRSDQNESRGRARNRNRGRGQERPEKREPKPRLEVDSKDMAKKAWQIFESEVTEEGLALLDDNGLRDYARSSFNAARLFLEEEGRLIGRQKQAKQERKQREKNDRESQAQSQPEDDA